MSNTFEVVACETILQDLLWRMVDGPDLWESVCVSTTQSCSPPVVITFEDVENARDVSKLWRREIDNSTEYACLRLAKWDYDSYSEGQWTPKKDLEAFRFNVNQNIFKSSWILAHPIRNDKLETASFGELRCIELDQLRSILMDNRNQPIWVEPGEKVIPSDGIWVSPKHR